MGEGAEAGLKKQKYKYIALRANHQVHAAAACSVSRARAQHAPRTPPPREGAPHTQRERVQRARAALAPSVPARLKVVARGACFAARRQRAGRARAAPRPARGAKWRPKTAARGGPLGCGAAAARCEGPPQTRPRRGNTRRPWRRPRARPRGPQWGGSPRAARPARDRAPRPRARAAARWRWRRRPKKSSGITVFGQNLKTMYIHRRVIKALRCRITPCFS